MIRRLYPNGYKKAFNISYDDGVLQDIRFVQLLNKYHIPGTFCLNSDLMQDGFVWVHPNGDMIKRLPLSDAASLYRDHEVASHTLTHPDFTGLPADEILRQMQQDKDTLQRSCGCEVTGFGVPFDYFDITAMSCARACGFLYARNSEQSLSYTPPYDYYNWSAGIFHLNPLLGQYVQSFFDTEEELALCQIVGHAYDLDIENMWDRIERILKRVSQDDTVICLTHSQLVTYLKAMRTAWVSDDVIDNRSSQALWFEVDGSVIKLLPGQRYTCGQYTHQ